MAGVKGPYAVRLITPDDQRDVKLREGPTFSHTWRGGFKDAQIKLYEPLDSRSPLLSPMSKLRIEDRRTCRTVWEGYLDLPGKSRSRDDGDVWDIGAVGPMARLSDRQLPYIVIDRDLSGWRRSTENVNALVSARAEVGTHPNDPDIEAMVLQFPPGAPIGPNTLTLMRYGTLDDLPGQVLGGYAFTAVAGNDLAGTRMQSRVGPTFTTVHDDGLLTVPIDHSARWTIHWVGSDKTVITFRMIRTAGATNVTVDTHWAAFYDVHVAAKMFDLQGVGIDSTDIYVNGLVLAHEVIADALWRFTSKATGDMGGPLLPTSIDILGASIDQTFTHQIDQFAYMEPTTMAGTLEDLALFEPDMAWGAFESNANLRHRFAVWRAHDGSTVAGSAESGARYLATSRDGWDAPGGEADLRNGVTVAWTDGAGRERSKSYRSSDFGISVPELDQWGIERDADEPIDLGSQLGSEANADRIAEQYLRRASSPPDSGTLTVTRKIHDAWKGTDVHPWEIEPGYPLLIQDLDILLPITDIDVDDNIAHLTLNEPVLTDEQLVNAFARRRRRRGNR